MTIYLDLIRFSFLRFFSYPFEIVASVLKRVVEIVFLVLFWTIYAKTSNTPISITQITAYFLLAIGIADISMARWGKLGALIGNLVKTGQISNYIIKPIRLIPALYCISVGREGLRFILAILNLIIGICLFPPHSVATLLVFFLFLINSWAISLSYNVLVGTLFLHFIDASGIRNALENFTRVLTGTMIPLYMFPSPLKEILRFTPFPSMVYLPANSFRETLSKGTVLDLSIGLFWVITLGFISSSLWRYSMKKYEAVGI